MNIFLRLEILVFFSSFGYILYFLYLKFAKVFTKFKKVIKQEDISTVKTALNKIDLTNKEESYKREEKRNLTTEEKIQISELLKRVKINSTKGYFDQAKALIVEGLSIDKFNKDLNLELAIIYEKEKKFESAAYIYRDLLEKYPDDLDILRKLAYSYVLEEKLNEALEVYERIHQKDKTDDKTIEMLSEITYSIGDYEKSLKYLNFYLKANPRDVNKLTMKAYCFENSRNFKEAYEIHRKIVELQPYNTHSNQKLRELEEYI